jgi:flagellar basal-body rod modification protein FlgD
MVLGKTGDTSFKYDLKAFAHTMKVDVLDEAGQLVYSEAIGPKDSGTYDWTWDGRDADGTRQVAGTYSVRVTALDAEGLDVGVDTYRLGLVEGVEYSGGNAYLVVGGQLISLGNIQRISMAE